MIRVWRYGEVLHTFNTIDELLDWAAMYPILAMWCTFEAPDGLPSEEHEAFVHVGGNDYQVRTAPLDEAENDRRIREALGLTEEQRTGDETI